MFGLRSSFAKPQSYMSECSEDRKEEERAPLFRWLIEPISSELKWIHQDHRVLVLLVRTSRPLRPGLQPGSAENVCLFHSSLNFGSYSCECVQSNKFLWGLSFLKSVCQTHFSTFPCNYSESIERRLETICWTVDELVDYSYYLGIESNRGNNWQVTALWMLNRRFYVFVFVCRRQADQVKIARHLSRSGIFHIFFLHGDRFKAHTASKYIKHASY